MNTLMRGAEVVQNCYIVRDLEEACARLHHLYGIGPFLGGAEGVLEDHIHRGEPQAPIRIKGVFVQSGDLNIELVELVSDTPSAFHDMFAGGREGFHHVAVFCEDYAGTRDAWVGAGYEVASEFNAVGERICYIDTRQPFGHMLELYPEVPVIREMYRQTREAAADWDGKELIIPWDFDSFPA